MYDTLIVHCQRALQHSGLPKEEMRNIDDDWNKEDKKHAKEADY